MATNFVIFITGTFNDFFWAISSAQGGLFLVLCLGTTMCQGLNPQAKPMSKAYA